MRSQASRHDDAPRTQAHPTPDEAMPPAAPPLGSARLALPPRGLRRLSQVFFRRSSAENVGPAGGPRGATGRGERRALAAPRAALELAPPDAHRTGVRVTAPRGPTAALLPPNAFGDATPLAGHYGPTPVPDAPQRGGSLPLTPTRRAALDVLEVEDSQRTFVEPPCGDDRGPGPGPSARRLSNFTYAQQEAERSGLGPEDADAHATAREVLQSPIHLREGSNSELAWALPAYIGDAPLGVELGDWPPVFLLPHVWDDGEGAMGPADAADTDALLRALASPLQLADPRPGYFSRAAEAGPRSSSPATPQAGASPPSPASSDDSSLADVGAMRLDVRRA